MSNDFDWEGPPVSADDQRLIDAYIRTGLSLDELAYTKLFEDLVASLGRPATREEFHSTYRRLLTLRKRGRLPRLIDART